MLVDLTAYNYLEEKILTVFKRLPGTPIPTLSCKTKNGVTIAGDEWGNPNNPPVILLHGGGQTRHAWKNTGKALSRAGFYAIALDARGHGDSDWSPTGDYDQDLMVSDLKEVCEELNISNFSLVGASMGGGTGLIAAGEERIKIKTLVLVDIAPQIESDGVKRILEFMDTKPDGFNSLEEVAALISNYQPHRKKTNNLSGLKKNLRIDDKGKYRWHWDPKFISMRTTIERRKNRLEECAKKLSIPTLLVRGGLSDVLSEAGANNFLQLCKHAEYSNVASAAHMVAGDRNDIFAKTVIEFLSRHTD